MRYNKEQLAAFPFILSSDTMRLDHIAAAYIRGLDALGLGLCDDDRAVLEQWSTTAGDAMGPYPLPDTAELQEAMDAAESLLQDAAPAGFYFGSSDYDGALLGYFLLPDWEEALETLGAADLDGTGAALFIQALQDGGVDPGNLEDTFHGVAEGYTEESAGADYAQQLAEDLGVWDPNAQWPGSCIDWDAAWRDLRIGDGYWLEHIPQSGDKWAVFRSC